MAILSSDFFPTALFPLLHAPFANHISLPHRVQFYNNGNCNHGAAGFIDSVRAWSDYLSNGSAKLYIAALASPDQGSGFVGPDELAVEVQTVKGLGLFNFGGYALWDASLGMEAEMGLTVKKAL